MTVALPSGESSKKSAKAFVLINPTSIHAIPPKPTLLASGKLFNGEFYLAIR